MRVILFKWFLVLLLGLMFPSACKSVIMEPIDLVRHGGIICNEAWIPYDMRVDKDVYDMPKDGNPYRYIKNYDPRNERHRRIVENARNKEK